MNANEHNAVKKPVSRFSIWGLAFGCVIGMSREFAARVFDAFERERASAVNNIEGTGLGMAITKNLVTHFQACFNLHNTNICDIRKKPLSVTHEFSQIMGEKKWIFLYVAYERLFQHQISLRMGDKMRIFHYFACRFRGGPLTAGSPGRQAPSVFRRMRSILSLPGSGEGRLRRGPRDG